MDCGSVFLCFVFAIGLCVWLRSVSKRSLANETRLTELESRVVELSLTLSRERQAIREVAPVEVPDERSVAGAEFGASTVAVMPALPAKSVESATPDSAVSDSSEQSSPESPLGSQAVSEELLPDSEIGRDPSLDAVGPDL